MKNVSRPRLFYVCRNSEKRILADEKFRDDEFRAHMAFTSDKGRLRIKKLSPKILNYTVSKL